MREQFWIDADAVADVINDYAWQYDGLNRLTDEIFTTNLDDVLDGQTAIGLPANADLPNSSRPLRDYHDHYTFELTGNRLEKTTDLDVDGDLDRTVESDYDANDRLLSESHDDNADATVDRTTLYGYGPNNSATYQTSKEVYQGDLSALGPQLSALSLSYDLQGRLWIAISTTFDGTSNNTPTRIERTTYDYDHTGIRVSALHETDADANDEFETAVKTKYLVDANNFTGYQQVIRETHTNAATGERTKVITYAFGLDELSQTTVEFTNNQPDQPVTLYFTHDGHGSVRSLLDAVAAIATVAGVRQLFTFDAYGNANGFAESSSATNLLYSGEQFDQRVMMQYLRARYYRQSTGLFVTLDSYAGDQETPVTLHKYGYGNFSPITQIDPSGRFAAVCTLSVSSIGAFFNGITGETGNTILSALINGGRADLQAAAINIALAGMAIAGVILSKMLLASAKATGDIAVYLKAVHDRLPKSGWSGTIGSSVFKSAAPEFLAATAGKGVRFRGNFPDFSDYVHNFIVQGGTGMPQKVETQIELSTRIGSASMRRADDFDVADEWFARTILGEVDPTGQGMIQSARNYRNGTHPNFVGSQRFTWHHHEDMRTMQLVPTDIHAHTPHTGGRGLLDFLLDL